MATFTMTVTTNVAVDDKPTIVSQTNTSCETTITINVKVPAGQTRYIQVIAEGPLTTSSYTSTINTNTNVLMAIQGNTESEGNPNTVISINTLNVRLTNTSDVYYSKSITRKHSGIPC